MNGADHYRVAEQLLVDASAHECGSIEESYCLRAAQAHATLALAAAQVLPMLDWRDNAVKGNAIEQNLAWRKVMSD